jgi:hypothetical protein
MRVRHLYIAVVAASVACATTPNNTSGVITHRSNVLTAEEIMEAHADATSAYDAVARLRPNWLVAHGLSTSSNDVSNLATVFIDGQEMGDVSALKNVQAFQVGSIHYYNVTEAGAKFGVRAGTTGAVEVIMKSPNTP